MKNTYWKISKSSGEKRHSIENDQDNWKTWTKTWPTKSQQWQRSTGKDAEHIGYDGNAQGNYQEF